MKTKKQSPTPEEKMELRAEKQAWTKFIRKMVKKEALATIALVLLLSACRVSLLKAQMPIKTDTWSENPVMDTGRVMLFYVDTTPIPDYYYTSFYWRDSAKKEVEIGKGRNRFPGVFWQFGYEVTQQVFVPAGQKLQSDNFSVLVWEAHYETKFIGYLNEEKNLLSKEIVVIQKIYCAKPLKP